MVRRAEGVGPRRSRHHECPSVNGDDAREGRPASDADLSARLARLDAQLDRKAPAAPADHATGGDTASGASPLGQAMRLSTEFVAGVIAGGILGWIFDRLLGTRPWGLMVFLMLGFLTGIYNVMRLSGFLGKPGNAATRAENREKS